MHEYYFCIGFWNDWYYKMKNKKLEPMVQHVSLDDLMVLNRFESEYERAVALVVYVASWLDVEVNEAFKKHDITRPQYNLIKALYNNHPKKLSTGVITSRMIDRTSNVTRLADRLIPKGILVRTQNETNRRIHELSLTPKGVKLAEELDKLLRKSVWSIPQERLSEKELETLVTILFKLKGIPETK